jgi:hypothetical protein
MCCQQKPLKNQNMQLDSSVVVQDQNTSQQQADLTAAAAAAVPGGVQTEAGKLAQVTTAQKPPSEQQQVFTLLLSGVPLSYTDVELLPLVQQVRTPVYVSGKKNQRVVTWGSALLLAGHKRVSQANLTAGRLRRSTWFDAAAQS